MWKARRAAGIQLPQESREIWGPTHLGKILSVKSEGANPRSASKDKNPALKEQGEGEARLGHEK